jgi:hypothetical protein
MRREIVTGIAGLNGQKLAAEVVVPALQEENSKHRCYKVNIDTIK